MRIDELFDEINETDVKDLDLLNTEGNMSPDKQNRIETLVRAKIRKEKNFRKSKFRKKNMLRIILVAVFLLGMTAYGAERNEWDLAIMNYMGIQGDHTELLEGGVVSINATDSDGGITVQGVSSVGDKNSVYIRVDTDYVLGDSFDPETDYVLPYNYQIKIENTGFGMKQVAGYGSTLECFDNNGMLSFMILISNCEDINRRKVSIQMDDLYLYHDQENELLSQGTWTLSWSYSYPSNVETFHPFEKVRIGDVSCLITKVEISPISIRVQGIKNPGKGKQLTVICVEKIIMKDGSVIVFDPENSSGGCKDSTFLEGYRDVLEMEKVIDPSLVKSIVIGGEEIILR